MEPAQAVQAERKPKAVAVPAAQTAVAGPIPVKKLAAASAKRQLAHLGTSADRGLCCDMQASLCCVSAACHH